MREEAWIAGEVSEERIAHVFLSGAHFLTDFTVPPLELLTLNALLI
jgi:hypothetical protein